MMNKLMDSIGYAAYKALTLVFSLLPRRLCLAAGRSIGLLAFRLDRKHRAVALGNLTIAFGKERPPSELAALAKKAFKRLGSDFADILKVSGYPREKVLRLIMIEGRNNIENALAQDKGVLLFSAHFGNWEFAPASLTEIGRLWVVARALDNPFLEKELGRMRMKLGAGIINKFGAARPILQALGRNEIVAILIDQNVLRSQAVFVDFFGKAAATTPSLAAFHLKTGAPLVPIFVHPGRSGRYVVKIREPLSVSSSGSMEEDVLKITQLCTKIIEHEIRQNPELWFWVHKRWNTRPVDEVTTV
jgi:KDO2-lipid IV(A) lauroyltransferase